MSCSCSDKTHSTTWLHPRTGEPVNSGHMIRSGTRQINRFVGYRGDGCVFWFFAAVCFLSVAGRSVCFFCSCCRLAERMGRGLHGRRSKLLHQVSGLMSVVDALFDRVQFGPFCLLLKRLSAPFVSFLSLQSHAAAQSR